MFVKIATDER